MCVCVCVCVCILYFLAVPVNYHGDEVKPSSNLRLKIFSRPPPTTNHDSSAILWTDAVSPFEFFVRADTMCLLCPERWTGSLFRSTFCHLSVPVVQILHFFETRQWGCRGCEAGRKNSGVKYKRSLRHQQMAVASHHGQQKVLINILCKGSQYLL